MRSFAVALVAGLVLLLAGCRLDVDTTATMNTDGTGEVALTATVDADVVAQTPGLAESLQFDDATNAGWTVEGPTDASGGLTVTLRHPFASPEDATTLFASIGAPFTGVTFTRTATVDSADPTAEPDEIAFAVAGSLVLPGGTFDAFADADLTAALSGAPFAAQVQAAGATPASSMSVDLTLRLPGTVVSTTGSEADGAITWSAPLDGSTVDLATQTVVRSGDDGGGGGIWGTIATIALVLLVIWLVIVAAVAALRYRATRR